VRAYLNSVDIEQGTDAFASAASAEAWLGAHGLSTGRHRIGDADRARLIEVREALRDLLAARGTNEPVNRARGVLDRAARESPLRVDFPSSDAAALEPAGSGVHVLIGRILAVVAGASVAGTWSRLKVCRNDACRWAFYDASKNHSGVWCSMAVCGNRFKGRAFRRRRRGGARVPGPPSGTRRER
jgi:predicted RNA-binding Zn ribbon-like protein